MDKFCDGENKVSARLIMVKDGKKAFINADDEISVSMINASLSMCFVVRRLAGKTVDKVMDRKGRRSGFFFFLQERAS